MLRKSAVLNCLEKQLHLHRSKQPTTFRLCKQFCLLPLSTAAQRILASVRHVTLSIAGVHLFCTQLMYIVSSQVTMALVRVLGVQSAAIGGKAFSAYEGVSSRPHSCSYIYTA